jgi:hypothetical protein
MTSTTRSQRYDDRIDWYGEMNATRTSTSMEAYQFA